MLFDPVYANLQAQKDFATIMNLSEEDGNKKKHKDASQDSIFEHVQLLLDKGYIDLLKDQIGAFKQLSDEELLQAFGYAQENGNANDYNKSIREKLNGVDRKIEEISKRYEKYASIKNPFDPDSEEFLDYDGFELARKAAIYNEYTFDQAEKRMASILQQTKELVSKFQIIRQMFLLKLLIILFENKSLSQLTLKFLISIISFGVLISTLNR